MFFSVSPVAKNARRREEDESEEVAVISLAPFSRVPLVHFDNVQVGTVAIQKVVIQNTLAHNVQVVITHHFPKHLNANFTWLTKPLEKNSEVSVDLIWMPQTEESCRHLFCVGDGGPMKKEVAVIFKSVEPKQRRILKPKEKSKYPVRTKNMAKSPAKRPVLPNITNIPKIACEAERGISSINTNIQKIVFEGERELLRSKQKENQGNTFILSESSSHSSYSYGDEYTCRRETYIVQPVTTLLGLPLISEPNNSAFVDSLEPVCATKSPNRSILADTSHVKSFHDSKISTPKDCVPGFNPSQFSTESKPSPNEKVRSSFEKKMRLFPDDSNPELLSQPLNLSIKSLNLTSETYVKANISASTYVKDSSVGDIESLQLSPVCSQEPRGRVHDCSAMRLQNLSGTSIKDIIEANLWSSKKEPKPLKAISEECRTSDSFYETLPLKRKSSTTFTIVPPKKANVSNDGGIKSWSKRGGVTGLRVAKKTTGLNLKRFLDKTQDDGVVISKQDTNEVIVRNPFLLAASEDVDPFMSAAIYCKENWIEEQEQIFKKWLNALLTPPVELITNSEGHPLDVGKLWRECRKNEVATAPTKEMVSNAYHTGSRLNSLRKNARILYRSKDMCSVLSKVFVAIDSGKLSMRQDRDVHLDLSLQSNIMSIILSYNPLWLRIALETTYNEIIPLKSNSDVMGLSMFIINRFFRNPTFLKKHKSVHAPKYIQEIKRFVLKKFFALIYFLDVAKQSRLIPHDPCLFCKNAPVKESREALIQFTRDTLAAMGDIAKYLKLLGYIVQHKQTYINEFDYGVNCLSTDLRDGVRLTRVMEIILMTHGLTNSLRVPAISRLQKIHNTKIAFDALTSAGFNILYDISPKDIVDGHKEKTLSFLWQIIYKFEAPLMVKSATIIQTWWRCPTVVSIRQHRQNLRKKREQAAKTIQQWYRRVKLARQLEKFVELARLYIDRKNQNNAATKIQSLIRMYVHRRKYIAVRAAVITLQRQFKKLLHQHQYNQKVSAAIVIQSYVRMFIARRKYQNMKYSVLVIENMYIANRLMQWEKSNFDSLKHSAIIVQRTYRAKMAMRKQITGYRRLKQATIKIQMYYRAVINMRKQREAFLSLKVASIILQRRYRARLSMLREKSKYDEIKQAVTHIQRWYRAVRVKITVRDEYQLLKQTAILIQRRFRAKLRTRIYLNNFKRLKEAAIIMQRRRRANLAMRVERDKYQRLRQASVLIQRRFMALHLMKTERRKYLQLQNAVTIIQRRHRANLAMKLNVYNFNRTKQAIMIIQRWYRSMLSRNIARHRYIQLKSAATAVQRRYRAIRAMRTERQNFARFKMATIIIQRQIRANKAMKLEFARFNQIKNATVLIQLWFRATQTMLTCKEKYQQMRQASITIQKNYRMRIVRKEYDKMKENATKIQCWYRSKVELKIARCRYMHLKQAALVTQRRYRATLAMRAARNKYLNVRQAAVKIQTKFRATVLMRSETNKYQQLKQATVTIQRWFRATRTMLIERDRYRQLKSAATAIQIYYRGLLATKNEMNKFKVARDNTIKIQRWYRNLIVGRTTANDYLVLRRATIAVQRRYRAKLTRRSDINRYICLKEAAITIQKRLRATLLMRAEMKNFQTIKHSVVAIQRHFRATLTMQVEKERYQKMKKSSIVIQRRYRALAAMRKQRNKFVELTSNTIKIQNWYRSIIVTKRCQSDYDLLRRATVITQIRYRAKLQMRIERKKFEEIKSATIKIQRFYRAVLIMRLEMTKLQTTKNAAIQIQRRFRATQMMKVDRNRYQKLREATILIQKQYKSLAAMRTEVDKFTQVKHNIIKIQRWYRSVVLMKTVKNNYEQLREIVIKVQTRYRAKLRMRRELHCYNRLKTATLSIQRYYRGMLLTRIEQQKFYQIKRATVTLQTRYKARQLMLQEVQRFTQVKQATIVIQRYYRNILAAREIRKQFRQLRVAAVTIQQRYRAVKVARVERRNFILLKTVCLTIQIRYRSSLIEKIGINHMRTVRPEDLNMYNIRTEMDDYRRRQSAALLIQRHYRATIQMRSQRQKYQQIRQAVIQIQRTYKTKLFVRQLTIAAVCVQRHWRNNLVMKMQRRNYVTLRNATVKIQRWYRASVLMRKDRKRFKSVLSATLTIQRSYRAHKSMVKERQSFCELRKCTILIQNRLRSYLLSRNQRRLFLNTTKCVITIQRWYRNVKLTRILRKEFLAKLEAVKTIQRYYRRYMSMKREEETYLKRTRTVVGLQKYIRGYQVRKRYAYELSPEGINERHLKKQRDAAAVRIQAFWRGYRTRSQENSRFFDLRHKLQKACAAANSSDVLKYKLKQNFSIVREMRKSIVQIAEALKKLESYTRVSQELCIQLSTQSDRFYTLIASTSRSQPEMEACTYAAEILINIVKYPPSRDNSFLHQYMEVILDVMLHWCDKEAPLFPTLCTLLWLFAHTEEYKRRIISTLNYVQKFCKIGKLIERRENMTRKVTLKRVSLFDAYSGLPMPSLEPDWGIIRQDKPKIFMNSIQAFNCVSDILS